MKNLLKALQFRFRPLLGLLEGVESGLPKTSAQNLFKNFNSSMNYVSGDILRGKGVKHSPLTNVVSTKLKVFQCSIIIFWSRSKKGVLVWELKKFLRR